jgi:hypothetical protein
VEFSKKTIYQSILRASFAKCFDYAALANSSALNADNAFFFTGTLRSICEDLIVLRWTREWQEGDRNRVMDLEIQIGVLEQLERQAEFFSRFRPCQPVLKPALANLKRLREEEQKLWRTNGFPNENRTRPSTDQIAQKIGVGTLGILYDYIFRLTSDTVHFNARALLRTGFGDEAVEGSNFSYYVGNLGGYELACTQIYSAFLLTIYFEFFPRILEPSDDILKQVKDLRRALTMIHRWPEMVTYEEMNSPLPKGHEVLSVVIRLALAETFGDGFINAGDGMKVE